MPLVVEREELEMLRRIEELSAAGKNQTEIADALGINLATLRSRVLRLGFAMNPAVQLRTIIGSELFSELDDRGEVVARISEALEAVA